MKIARSTSDLSNVKILSLSYIFPVDKYSKDTSITKYFKENVNNHIFNQLYSNIIIEKASTETVIYCKSTSDREQNNFQPVGVLNEKIKACCKLLRINSQVSIQETSETSFMNKYLVPYLNEVFMVDTFKYIVFGMVDGVEESGAIPDFKIGCTKNKNKPVYAFFVEFKRPGQSSQYQAENYKLKLLKEMKDSVNK